MSMVCPKCNAEMKPLFNSWYCPYEEQHVQYMLDWHEDHNYEYAATSSSGIWGRLTQIDKGRWMWEIGKNRIMARGEESTSLEAILRAEQFIRYRESLGNV